MHAPTSFRLNRLISMNSEGKPGHKVYERASGNHQASRSKRQVQMNVSTPIEISVRSQRR